MALFKRRAIIPCLCVRFPALAVAQGWRGIVPMQSTCEDVKRILAVQTCDPLIGRACR